MIAAAGRFVTWTVFLTVLVATLGVVGIGVDDGAGLSQLLLSLLTFTGLPVVALAEFHIQRFPESGSTGPVRLALVLLAMPITFYIVGVVTAHSSLLVGALAMSGWFLIFLVLPLSVGLRREKRRLIVLAVFLAAGTGLLAVLCFVAWPALYERVLRAEGHLEWTPWLMGVLGFLAWSALWLLARRLRVPPNPRMHSDHHQRASPAGSGR